MEYAKAQEQVDKCDVTYAKDLKATTDEFKALCCKHFEGKYV